MPVDENGSAIINYFGPPGNYKANAQYVSFGDVARGAFDASKVKDKIVLIGDYFLTGVNDQVTATTSAGAGGLQMAGVEMHANVLQMLLGAPPKFLTHEEPLIVYLILLLAGLLMALLVARLKVIWGFVATVVALLLFTVVVAYIAINGNLVPDLFHPWMTIGLVYTGVTAYRFLYEDRERRKVTSLFGQYLKPEIVAQLAKQRGGVDDILRGGERRDITLLFVDVRGFTSMSESMAAEDVTALVQMYLDHLSGIIFTWDGTIDKYVGDEIVAFWNAPRDQADHALLAVRCAYDLRRREGLRRRRSRPRRAAEGQIRADIPHLSGNRDSRKHQRPMGAVPDRDGVRGAPAVHAAVHAEDDPRSLESRVTRHPDRDGGRGGARRQGGWAYERAGRRLVELSDQ